MAQLIPFPLDHPGVAGLNMQHRSTILGPEWATVMDNLVIDEQGRMAFRKGTKAVTDTGAASDIETTFVSTTSAGVNYVYAADDTGELYNNATTATTLTNRSGTATTGSDGNYKFQNFNGKVVAFHGDGSFLVQSSPTGDFADIVFALHTPGAFNDVLSAFGRLWAVTDTHLYWSDLLDETTWRTSGTATDAGFLELARVWPGGADVGVALAEFNGNLVIFGKHSTVIYADPVSPLGSGFVKVEAIDGTGCIARDTIQTVGRDLLWVSNSGLKSLGRVIQEKSLPLNDSLPQMRDYLVASVSSTATKSAYSEKEGLYLITTPDETFAINVKNQLPDGSYRCTLWDTFPSCAEAGDGSLLLSSGTKVFAYSGYVDGADSSGVGGTALAAEYHSGWVDFGTLMPEAAPQEKTLKRLFASFYGGSEANVTFKWAVNFVDTFGSSTKALPASGTQALYGVAQFGVDSYGQTFTITREGTSASYSGRVVKIGLSITNSTTETAVNRMDLYAKLGKLRMV